MDVKKEATITGKDVRLEITGDGRKPVPKVVPHSRVFFESPGYHSLTQENKTQQKKKLDLSKPVAFSAFSWCFSLLATGMMIFVLFLLLFLMYETVTKQDRIGKANPEYDQITLR